MNSLRQHLARGYVLGMSIAFSGALLSRCLAPHLTIENRPLCQVSGQIVAFAGLFILACTIKARAEQRATAAIAAERSTSAHSP